MKAIWNGQVIAERHHIVNVEGNSYFPLNSVNKEYLIKSETHTRCPWKGIASYYDVEVDGKTNRDAAWYYPSSSDLASSIKERIAFWKGVEITEH